MGYDFMLEKAKVKQGTRFPADFEAVEIGEGDFPLEDLKGYILERGGVTSKSFSSNPDSVRLEWEIPDKGSISVDVNRDYASLDMHAEWSVVLELLIWIRERDPDVLLADTNVGKYHDVDSFRKLVNTEQ